VLRVFDDMVFEATDLIMQPIHNGNVSFDIEPNGGVLKMDSNFRAIGFVDNVLLESLQVILIVRERYVTLDFDFDPY